MRRVQYVPLKRQTLYNYAKQVGFKATETSGNTAFSEEEVIQGLADFLAVVARIKANQLNRQGQIDKHGKEV